MGTYISTAAIAAAITVVCYFGYQEIRALQTQNDRLTLQLEGAIETLNKVAEHSQKVEEATARLEKADEARVRQLRGFERNLSKLAAASEEDRAFLGTVVPDKYLDGLRSFAATPRANDRTQGAAVHVGAP